MSHNQDENTLHFNDADVVGEAGRRITANDGRVHIYPGSPASGLACIAAEAPVLLTVDDVVALRDFLTLALEQAGVEGPAPTTTSYCRHCRRPIAPTADEGWIDPEAGYDDEDGDGVWRVTCDAHDAFQADHEPINEDDLDFARETLGPDALPYHVVELALERADRDGKEIC